MHQHSAYEFDSYFTGKKKEDERKKEIRIEFSNPTIAYLPPSMCSFNMK